VDQRLDDESELPPVAEESKQPKHLSYREAWAADHPGE
jgi:hypothetical protein